MLEKGVGALSLRRYEARKVIIDSSGLFGGIGSHLILPDEGQKARILNAEAIDEIPAVLRKLAAPRAIDKDSKVPSQPQKTFGDPSTPGPAFASLLKDPAKAGARSIPQIVLKGRVISSSSQPMALIEAGGVLYTVRRNSVISSGGYTLRVLTLTSSGVQIEIGPLKEIAIIN